MSQAYLRLLRPSPEPPAEANPPINPSTTSTEDDSTANPSATSTKDNSSASPSRTSTEDGLPANLPNFTKFRVQVSRNVHFLDAYNKEVAGFWQNGSVIWEEVQEWMQIAIETAQSDYTPFRCLEAGDPENPAGQHGPPIYMVGNGSTVDAGYYVLLACNGECESLNHHIHFIDTLITYRFQRKDRRHS
jgi:hypothetical protein